MIKELPFLSNPALPSFKDTPPPSNSLLRSLIARLPEENRDLRRTLVDVVARSGSSSSEAYTDAPESLEERESLYSDNRASEDHSTSMSDSQPSVNTPVSPKAVGPQESVQISNKHCHLTYLSK